MSAGSQASRARDLGHIALAYTVALIVGVVVFQATPELLEHRPQVSLLLRTALADVVATVVIYAFSLAWRNTSFYDAYWSLAPMVIVLHWAAWPDPIEAVMPVVKFAYVLGVWVWGVRLTRNWLRHWQGLHHEDWRYVDFRERYPRTVFELINLFGLHGFPTVQVFLGLLPAWALMRHTSTATLGPMALALVLMLLATAIEHVADRQLHTFLARRTDPSEYLDQGLWRLSRHPNYFGEILFWWGLYLPVPFLRPELWWTGVGALAITVMFVFVSLPLIERRALRKRPHYAEHIARTSAIVPWFPKS